MAKQQYCGPLDYVALAKGMNAARANARRLVEDARLLFQNGRYASAVGICILAIEESGKQHVLRELALARDEGELREAWNGYRSHIRKNVMWLMQDMYHAGGRKASDFLKLFDPGAEHTQILNELKQISFYTDSYKRGHWSVPNDVISRDVAEGLLEIANNLAHAREITAEEMELWIEYMQPVWKTTDSLMQKALFEWDRELRRRGLIPESSTTMEQFFTKGFGE